MRLQGGNPSNGFHIAVPVGPAPLCTRRACSVVDVLLCHELSRVGSLCIEACQHSAAEGTACFDFFPCMPCHSTPRGLRKHDLFEELQESILVISSSHLDCTTASVYLDLS